PILERPRCLRLQGPAAVVLHDEAGRVAALTVSGFHLRSGQQYTLRVRPPRDDRPGLAPVVTVAAGESLLSPGPVLAPGPPGAAVEFVATFLARCVHGLPIPGLDRIIWPAGERLLITLHRDGWEPFTLDVPVMVWPSLKQQLLGAWCVAVGLASPC